MSERRKATAAVIAAARFASHGLTLEQAAQKPDHELRWLPGVGKKVIAELRSLYPAQPKKRGRPPKARRTNGNFTFRTPIGLRERMEAAAVASGRSVSEEVTARLERSFLLDDMRQVIREEVEKVRPQQQALSIMDFGNIVCGSPQGRQPVPSVYGPDQSSHNYA